MECKRCRPIAPAQLPVSRVRGQVVSDRFHIYEYLLTRRWRQGYRAGAPGSLNWPKLTLLKQSENMGRQIGSKLLLALKEKPSFEGELCAHLLEDYDAEGRAKYFLSVKKHRHSMWKNWLWLQEYVGALLSTTARKLRRA